MKEALIVFVKNPKKGKVKTRLAADIGEEKALKVYCDLISFSKSLIYSGLNVYVFHSPSLLEDFFWANTQNELQVKGDLGVKMSTAIQQVLSDGSDKVCVIGSDCFEITQAHIKEAFRALDNNDLVLGPAKDGGYYLIGMKTLQNAIFEEMPWSHPDLMQATLSKAKNLNLNYELLEELSDVDFVTDLPKDYKY